MLKKMWFPILSAVIMLGSPLHGLTKQEKAFLKHINGQKPDIVAKDWSGQMQMPYYTGITQHQIREFFPKEKTFEIENGAGFMIHDWDYAKIAAYWSAGIPVKISPVSYWNSQEYYITNLYTHEYVRAKLTRGSEIGNPTTLRVSYAFDKNHGDVIITNNINYNARFKISNSWGNMAELAKWEPGDSIIVGDYDGYFNGGYNKILINIATDSFVTAYQVQ